MSLKKSTYKDMEKYKKTRNAQTKRYYAKTAKYARRRWTEEEDDAVLRHDITDTELSEKISRSVHSIQDRRVRLKKQSK